MTRKSDMICLGGRSGALQSLSLCMIHSSTKSFCLHAPPSGVRSQSKTTHARKARHLRTPDRNCEHTLTAVSPPATIELAKAHQCYPSQQVMQSLFCDCELGLGPTQKHMPCYALQVLSLGNSNRCKPWQTRCVTNQQMHACC